MYPWDKQTFRHVPCSSPTMSQQLLQLLRRVAKFRQDLHITLTQSFKDTGPGRHCYDNPSTYGRGMDMVWAQNGLKIGLRISGQDKNEQHLWLGAVQL